MYKHTCIETDGCRRLSKTESVSQVRIPIDDVKSLSDKRLWKSYEPFPCWILSNCQYLEMRKVSLSHWILPIVDWGDIK